MDEFLKTALTYYENKDRLIYSYRGNTFLQGGELYDTEHNNRGRIDCSTLVHLALQQIPYEKSPYVTGDANTYFESACVWPACVSIGGPGRAVRDVLQERTGRGRDLRRANGMARYFRERGIMINEGDELKPGDIVFFEAAKSVHWEYVKYGAYMAISHVGIVAEDTAIMLNATGRREVEYNLANDAVKLTPIKEKAAPILTARLI